jgi:hypothetical protein
MMIMTKEEESRSMRAPDYDKLYKRKFIKPNNTVVKREKRGKRTPQQIEEIRKANIGKIITPQHRKNISGGLTGKKAFTET